MKISDLLGEGRENAKTGRELCDFLHIRMRDLSAAIEKERREGQPICAATSEPRGFFLAATQGEMQRYCDSLRHRAGELHKTRRACLQTMQSLPAEV